MIHCAFFCSLIVIGRLGYAEGELAIEFKIVRPDETSQLLTNDQVSANSASNDRLQIICRKSNIPNMADFSVINLYRITQSGEQQIATMQTRIPTNNGHKSPYLVASGTGGMQVVGSYSDTDPTLGISLPVNTLSCNDQHAYKCDLSYGYVMGQNYMSGVADVSKNLTVTVLPSRIELKAYNMSSSFAMNEILSTGLDSTSLAQFKIGQEIKLTCKAFLGTHHNGVILWRKSNIVAGSRLAPYFPNTGEHEVGQLIPTGCQFEKTDSITYNMTYQDSTRTTNNPLQFQCYISAPSSPFILPETTVQNFYIKVLKENDPTSSSVATTVKEIDPTSSGVATTVKEIDPTSSGDATSGELAIEFKIVRPDDTSQLLTNDQVSANSASNDRLQIICRKSNIPNMAHFDVINLYRITQSGEQPIATMQTRIRMNNGYKSPYLVASGTGGMQVVGSYSDTDPTLGISLPVNTLSCNDQHAYKCDLSYGYVMGQNYMSGVADVSKNLTVTVLPSRIELKAYNKSSSFAMNEILSTGLDSTSLAQFKIGQEIKLTCKAFLGTHHNGVILWRKGNIVAGSGLASYLPNTGEHEVGQLVPTGCQFEKTDSITYNMTDQDSTRTTNNPLQFQCYISAPSSPFILPETTVQNFYIKVSNVNEPTTGGLATAGSGDAGVIVGAVIGSLVGIVIIVLLVYFLWYRRRAAGSDCQMKRNSPVENSPGNPAYETLGVRVLSAEEYATLGSRVQPAEEYETLGSRVQSAEEYERIGPCSH